MSKNESLLKALRMIEDLSDTELVDIALVIEADTKEALRRRDAVRSALINRMHSKNATALPNAEGEIVVELQEKRTYEWDSSLLAEAFPTEKEREENLKWVPPSSGRWVPRNVTAIKNLAKKLGPESSKAKAINAAGIPTVTESLKFILPEE